MPLRWVGKFLPPQYRFAHEYSLVLHDELASFVNRIEKQRLNSVTITLKPEHIGKLERLEGEPLWQWLEVNGYSETVEEMVFRSCVHALLGDSCHFLYEALRCSEKAKLTVCFALLRKPLRDSLLFLEYLLSEPEKFLRSFWHHGPQQVAVETLLARRGTVQRIIAGAVERTIHPKLFDAEFLYQLRYDPAQAFSYDQLWTKAIHLVTTKRSAATEAQNLNFIFSDQDSRLDQWDHLYRTLPALLYHMADVATSLMIMMGDDDPTTPERILKRDLGLVLWARDPKRDPSRFREPRVAPHDFDCPSCGRAIPWSWHRYRAVFDGRLLICRRCRQKWPLAAFVRADESDAS